jgi:hypothetical protein
MVRAVIYEFDRFLPIKFLVCRLAEIRFDPSERYIIGEYTCGEGEDYAKKKDTRRNYCANSHALDGFHGVHKPGCALFFHPDSQNANGDGDDMDADADKYADLDEYAHADRHIDTHTHRYPDENASTNGHPRNHRNGHSSADGNGLSYPDAYQSFYTESLY